MSVNFGNIRSYFVVLVLPFLISGCDRFPESSFALASESRIPRWFSPPDAIHRSNLRVTLDYYIGQGGRTAVIKLYKNGAMLEKVEGKQLGSHPLTFTQHVLGQPPPEPAYEVITVGGVVDIVEHRKMEPIFYMTDDPAVWKKWAPDANRDLQK